MSEQTAAAIYTRVSSKGQEDGASLETQQAACEAFAAGQGYAIQGVYSDTFTGAALWERPALSRLREAVRRGEVGAVIVYALDRLSRKQAHIAILAEECERAGVALRFVTEDYERSSVGEFIRSAKAFAAELEREKISERTMRGRVAKVRAGRLAGNTPAPFGFRYDEGKTRYEEEPGPSGVVREIFRLALEGRPIRAIGAHLAAQGIASPSGLPYWNPASVRKVLTNPCYTGLVPQRQTQTTHEVVDGQRKRRTVRRPAEEVVVAEGLAPALVSAADFAAVQDRLRRNKAESPRSAKRPEDFLLRGGYVKDAATGRSMIGYYNTKGNRQYRHRVLVPRPGDAEHVISAQALDTAVWGLVAFVLGHPAHLRAGLAATAGAGQGGNVAAAEQAIEKVKRQQQNIVKMSALVEDEETRRDLAGQLELLAAQRKALEAEREAALARETRRASLDRQLAVLESMGAEFRRVAQDKLTYRERRDWLAALGIQVVVHPLGAAPRRYDVTLSIPLPDGREERILITNTSMPPWASPSSRRASASAASMKPARSTSASAPST